MKAHAALLVAIVIITYTVVVDFRFIQAMDRIKAYQADSRITLPDESDRFSGPVLDLAADNSLYLGGKRMSDEDLNKFLLANPGIKIELRCDSTLNYSKVKAVALKMSACGVKDIALAVVKSRPQE